MSTIQETTKQIRENIIAQLETTLNQTIPLLPKAFNRVLAAAVAAVFVILYKYGGFIFLQIFVTTASARETNVNGVSIVPLTQWGQLVGAGDPTAATQAELLIDITVENQGGTLASGAQLVNAATGVTYITLGPVSLNAAVVQASVRAVGDQAGGDGSGSIGNLDTGAIISFVNPLADVAQDASVVSQIVTGADAETTEAYRQRVIDRFQKRPQGGAYSDYELWGEEVPGIINVYPYTSGTCPGQVDVYSEATVASSGSPDGFPTVPQLQAVLGSINYNQSGQATRRPANALANSLSITRKDLTVQVSGMVVDEPATVEAEITLAVEEYALAAQPYIEGLSVPPRTDRLSQTAVAGIVQIIVSSAGGLFTTAVLLDAGSPVPFYTLGEGEKAKISSVTFI
jgi:uncharacterized phage protein gp47/JayE